MPEKTNTHLATEGDINFSPERKSWSAAITDPATRKLLAADARYFLHQSLSTPCLDVIKSAHGIYITNEAGNSYMDFHGNNVHQLGYHNTYIINRVKAQMDVLAFSPRRFTNAPAVELAESLAGLTNGELSRVLFAPGGTSAMGIALKLARIITGRFKTISMWDAFHGASMDSISVGGELMFSQGLGPLLPGNIHVPAPDLYRGIWLHPNNPGDDLAYAEYIDYVLSREGNVGAVVAETIRSTDVQVPSRAYWKKVREICTRHGVLLILDEIPICLGRTGSYFTFQQYDIQPDIVVIGKGLGAGLVPMAAMLCRDEYNKAAHVSLGHYTHEKNPLGAAAALASLDFMAETNVLDHVSEMSAFMGSRLDSMMEKYQEIGQVRGIGLLWGVELVKDRHTKEKHPLFAEKVLYRCLANGLSFKVSGGNVLSLYPPLIISREELSKAMDILEEAFAFVKSTMQE